MFRVLALWLLASQPEAWLRTLSEAHRAVVVPVIEHVTLQRDYPVRTFRGRREHFEFLMDNMTACSVLSESLGLIAYRAMDDGLGRTVADDRAGAKGSLQQVYCAEGTRVYYVEGTQRGLFQARGRGVVVVSFAENGPDTIQYTGKMFVKIDNTIVAALAQMFFAFVKGSVDRHFDHVMSQPVYLSRLALDDPATLRDQIERMPGEDYRRLAPFREALR